MRDRASPRGAPVCALLVCAVLAACKSAISPGQNYVVMATHSVRGAEVDLLPTVALVGISSFQGFAGPTGPHGETLPVLLVNEGRGPDSPRVLAIGPPALALAAERGDSARAGSADGASDPPRTLALDTAVVQIENGRARPDAEVQGFGPTLFGAGEISATWFGRDRLFGAQLEFFGPGYTPLPQSFALLYRYKELYLSPVFIDAERRRFSSGAALAAYSLGTHRDTDVLATGAAARHLGARASLVRDFVDRALTPATKSP